MSVLDNYECEGQMSLFDLDLWSGKTFQEPSVQTVEKISKPSSRKRPKSQTKMPLFLDLRVGNGNQQDVSWETDGLSLGEYMMPNIGEFHSGASAYVYLLTSTERTQGEYYLNCGETPMTFLQSKLSWILESNPDMKYNLSQKACLGILNRAQRRGKELPIILKNALMRQAGLLVFKSEQVNQGGGKGILIQNERTGALSTLNNQSVCAFEPGAASRDDVAGTVRANAGDNQQAVVSFGNGQLHDALSPSTEISKTLNCMDDPAKVIVYGISAYESNAMKSDNPNSGIYEAETARTLDLNGGSPACNQGGMAVVQAAGIDGYNQTMDIEVAQPLRAADGGDSTPKVVCLEGNGARESHRGNGYVESETMYTLNTVEQHAVAYRGDAITSPVNKSNPQPGDPCHTLTDDERNYVVLENHPADSRVKVCEDGVFQTLSSRMGTGGNNVPMVMSEVAAPRCAQDGRGAVHSQMLSNPEENFVLEPVCIGNGQLAQARVQDKVGALNCMHDQQAVITYGLDRASFNQGQNAKFNFSVDEEKVGALVAKGPGGVLPCASVDCLNGRETGVNGTLAANARKSLNSGNVVRCESVVRRLTPLECTRLQGFPDGWVDIGEWVDSKGKKHKDSDAPKYKALGNSIALPFWRWLAERIRTHYPDNNKTTMASLFSGIGGFELVFAQVGIEPVWASEIEDFPIAVTKMRFPDAE